LPGSAPKNISEAQLEVRKMMPFILAVKRPPDTQPSRNAAGWLGFRTSMDTGRENRLWMPWA
jgi:hypothetical protein